MNKQSALPEQGSGLPGDAPTARLLRLPAVLERVGCKQSKLYRMMKEGTFPRPLEITPGWKAWLEADIEAWIIAQKTTRSKPN